MIVVAGFIAEEDQWVRFDKEWRALLASKGLDFFKMQWFEKHKGPFRNWTATERRAFLNALLGIIRRRANLAIISGLALRDYDEIMSGPAKGLAGSAYATAANGCLLLARDWAVEYGRDSVAHVFDRGHVNSGDLLESFVRDPAREQINKLLRVSSVTLGDEIDRTPLQAADLIAYESWKHLENEYSSGKKRPRRYPFDVFMDMPNRTRMHDRAGLERLRASYFRRASLPRSQRPRMRAIIKP